MKIFYCRETVKLILAPLVLCLAAPVAEVGSAGHLKDMVIASLQ